MASKTLNIDHYIDGQLTDYDELPTFRDAAGTYGVRRADSLAVVVAAETLPATLWTKTATGQYEATITGLLDGVTYEYAVKHTYIGDTRFEVPQTFTASEDGEDRPVTWAEAKAHLRLDTDDDQSYVEMLIDAAADYAETRLAAVLTDKTISLTFYDSAPLLLRPGPVVSVTSVLDANGDPVAYTLRRVGLTDVVVPSGGGSYPLTVIYRANWTPLPPLIRLAILQHVATMYENRESVSDRTKTIVPHSLEAFYRAKSRDGGIG